MKTSILSTILCLTMVTVCGWRCATARAADDATELELRSLLAGEAVQPGEPEAPPVVAEQVRQAAATRRAPEASNVAASNIAASNADATSGRTEWAVEPESAADAGNDDATTPLPINPVPEPSAIILAVAALGYFLLFARRRRV